MPSRLADFGLLQLHALENLSEPRFRAQSVQAGINLDPFGGYAQRVVVAFLSSWQLVIALHLTRLPRSA